MPRFSTLWYWMKVFVESTRYRLSGRQEFETSDFDVSHSTVISFDAFDTLITRPVQRPSDIFLLCGHILKRKNPSCLEPQVWFELRVRAEADARDRAGRREITFDEIYARAAVLNSNPEFDISAVRSLELSLEAVLSRPIANNVMIVNRLAERGTVAVLSDTYLDESRLSALLTSCGVDTKGGRIFIMASSRTGETKANGDLFTALRRHFPSATRHIHIGDNVFSDVSRARQAGGEVKPYLMGSPTRYERMLAASEIDPPLFRSFLVGSVRAARLQTSTSSKHEQKLAAVSSGASAVLLFAFVVWLLGRAVALKTKRLYFLARDGEILKKIADRLIVEHNLPLEARYLYVSRQSLHLPAINIFTEQDAATLDFKAGHKLSEVFQKLDLPIDREIMLALSEASFPEKAANAPLSESELNQLILALGHEHIQPFIAIRASKHRTILIDYLQQERFFDPGEIAIVDIGWRGNLQRSICRVASIVDPSIRDRFHGIYFGLHNRPKDCGTLEAYIDQPGAAALRPYVRGTLFEAICAARHGTTLCYARQIDNSVTPVLASISNAEADSWGLPVQQEAILHFVDDLIATSRLAEFCLLDMGQPLSRAAEIVVRALVGQPSRADAEVLGSFPHSADQLHETFSELAPPLPFSPIEWARRIRLRHKQPIISYWPEGSIMRSFPRSIGVCLIWSISQLRKLRVRRQGS